MFAKSFIIKIAALIMISLPLISCFGQGVEKADANLSGKQFNLKIDHSKVLCSNFIGFGAQGDCPMTCKVNSDRGVNEQDKKKVYQRMLMSRPHIIRMFFAYQWWEPTEGVQTPDSDYVKYFVEYISFLKSIGCQINLCPWGDWFAYSDWMEPSATSRMVSKDKEKVMVRSLVDFIEFLRNKKDLTNVSYLTLMNEPDNSDRKPDAALFVTINRFLTDELIRRGMRDKIFIAGIDGSTWENIAAGDWFYDVLKAGGTDYFDGASAHTYGQSWDCPTLVPWIESRIEALAKYDNPPKPFMITEFGSFGPGGGVFTMSKNNDYGYGLFLARFAVTAVSRSAASVLMWCFCDNYYDSLNKQETGLLKWKDENWEPRPGFYSWSLLTRYTRPKSKVLAIGIEPDSESKNIAAAALLTEQGELTVLAVNANSYPVQVKLNIGMDKDIILDYFEYSQNAVPTQDTGIIQSSQSFDIKRGQDVELTLPAESFVVLTNVEEKIRSYAKDILSIKIKKPGFYVPDRAMIIAPDAYTAYQLTSLIKKQRPDFWVVTFDPLYENPVPLPDNITLKHMVGAFTPAFAITPGKGYPEDLVKGFKLTQAGNLYQLEPK